MKHFNITDEIFKTNIHFFVGCSFKQMEDWLLKNKKIKIDYEEGYFDQADGTTIVLEDKDYKIRVIWIQHKEHIGTVIHELYHCVLRILRDKNIPNDTTDCNDETGAYLMDYYTRQYFLNVPLLKDKKKADLKIY